MKTQVVKGQEARDIIRSAVNSLSEITSPTLGPLGRNVAIGSLWQEPQLINDGFTIANNFNPEDPFESTITKVLLQASDKTNRLGGDGTTATILLPKEIVISGLDLIEGDERDISTTEVNPLKLSNEIKEAAELVRAELKKSRKLNPTKKDIIDVARISAYYKELGDVVAEAVNLTGKNGSVTIEDAKNFETKVEPIKGIQFDKGHASTHIKGKVSLKDARILVTDIDIAGSNDLKPILNQVTERVVVITPSISNAALSVILYNMERELVRDIHVVEAPGFANNRADLLEDIAVATGAKFISGLADDKLADIKEEDLGHAGKVIITSKDTTILETTGDTKERIKELKKLVEQADSDFEKENYKKRIAKLSGGVAVIHVAGATEVELLDKKKRIEDAVNSAQRALEEGIVEGGGMALYKAREVLELDTEGSRILYEALGKPAEQILVNANLSIELLKNGGVNAVTRENVDMFEEGIVDSFTVIDQEVENAVSVSTALLVVESIIVPIEEKDEK